MAEAFDVVAGALGVVVLINNCVNCSLGRWGQAFRVNSDLRLDPGCKAKAVCRRFHTPGDQRAVWLALDQGYAEASGDGSGYFNIAVW